MPIARFQMPDGRVARFEVPEGTTPEQAQAMMEEAMPKETPKATKPSTLDSIKQGVGNLAAGAVRGAGSIGATLMLPADYINSALGVGQGGTGWERNKERRSSMDDFFKGLGVDTESLTYGGGKLAAEVAGTAGAGGGIANALTKVAPRAAAAMPAFVEAMRSGGLLTGAKAAPGFMGAVTNMAPRIAGGAVAGGAAAGLVNPEDAKTGALIGGALPPAVKGAQMLGSGVKQAVGGLTKNTLGAMTGTGAESVGTAYRAGKEGGTSFLSNLRGKVPFTDVLDEAKAALSKMRIEKSTQYKQGMAGVSADKTVVNFSPIEQAVNSLKSMGNYKGQVINKNASGTVNEIADLVDQWKALDPAEFHTPEGLDALKQAIGDIRDTTQFGTAARRAADTAYNAVKGEITKQAPTYAKVMKDYSEASELVKEIERSLSMGEKSSVDTAMRKLQSLMRNNVNTNYGNRLDLAKTLEGSGAEILPAVAGQSMSSWTPRGLQGATSGAALLAAYPTGGASLAALPFTSPRLAGEVAYGLGAMNRGIGKGAASSRDAINQLLGQSGSQSLSMEGLLPLLASGAVLSANQR